MCEMESEINHFHALWKLSSVAFDQNWWHKLKINYESMCATENHHN